MAKKKEIGNAFKSQLDQLDQSPSDELWGEIASALDKKDKKRRILVLPLWLKASGVAATLTILLVLSMMEYGNPIEQKVDAPLSSEEKKDSILFKKTNSHFTVLDTVKDSEREKVLELYEPSTNKKRFTNTANEIMEENAPFHSRNKSVSEKEKLPSSSVAQENGSMKTDSKKTLSEIPKKLIKPQEQQKNNVLIQDSEKRIALTKRDSATTKMQKIFPNEEVPSVKIADKTHENSYKERIQDSIATSISHTNTKDIQEEIQAQESLTDSIEDIASQSRWILATHFAPLYYNTLNGGSSLDPSLSENSRDSEITISYGIQAGYIINDKFTIRTGLNRLDLSYTTRNISTVNTTSSPQGGFGFSGFDIINPIVSPEILNPEPTNLDFTQKLTYYEIPLEVNYSLINNKLGLNLIAGFSTFFLDDDSVEAQVNDNETIIFGKATNLNTTTFSGNIGLGVNYQLSKQLYFSLEPRAQIQFNTYSNTSSTFKPYIIGVYSGIHYKF